MSPAVIGLAGVDIVLASSFQIAAIDAVFAPELLPGRRPPREINSETVPKEIVPSEGVTS